MLPSLAWLWLVGACSEWPLHAHLPLDTGPSWTQGASVDQALDWREEEWGTGELSASSRILYTHQGVLLKGSLLGSGYEPDAPEESMQDSASPCADDAAPPAPRSEYLGEMHWQVLEAASTGTLCLSGRSADTSLDWIPYQLTDCEDPQGPIADPWSGQTLGLDQGQEVYWAAEIEEGERWAILVAGYSPEDPDREVGVELALSLLPLGYQGSPGSCPEPGELPW